MPLVKLSDVVQELQMAGPEISGYINRKSGELISITDEEVTLAENDDISSQPEWQRDMIAQVKVVLDDDDYISLPDQFEIHEYAIMERFCYSIDDEKLQNALLRAISGRGALRSFKDRIAEEGVRDDWFDYRDAALKQIAADFLDEVGIPYVDE